jgi:hypothetical protein
MGCVESAILRGMFSLGAPDTPARCGRGRRKRTTFYISAGLLPPLNGRVWVVEDQQLNREVAIGILSSLGLEVETATTEDKHLT